MIRTLARVRRDGARVAGAPGIYVRLDDPFSHAALTGPAHRRRTRFAGLGKIAALGIKVSRHCTYHGVALNVAMDLEPFSPDQPLRLRRAAKRSTFLQSGSPPPGTKPPRVLGHKLRRCWHPDPKDPMSSNPVVREAQSVETYQATRQAEGRGQAVAHPGEGGAGRDPEEAGVDPRARPARASTRFYEIKQILREQQPAHGVRGSLLPEHRRVLRQGHGHLHDHGRQVHPPLPVLRRRPRPARSAGRGRAARTWPRPSPRCKLKYVVITSVDRDDLRDGGAGHFVDCIRSTRELSPGTTIEVLVPDFRGRDDRALEILKAAPPDVMNHNLETIPRLYKEARPGSDYQFSLNLLKKFKALHPGVPTKSGLMVGLGETDEEILQVDARHARARHRHADHRPVPRAAAPRTCRCAATCTRTPSRCSRPRPTRWASRHAAVGAMVRSSYHADQQAHAAGVGLTVHLARRTMTPAARVAPGLRLRGSSLACIRTSTPSAPSRCGPPWPRSASRSARPALPADRPGAGDRQHAGLAAACAVEVPPRTLALGIYGLFGYHFLLFIALRHGAAGGSQPGQLPVAAAASWCWRRCSCPACALQAAHVLAALVGLRRRGDRHPRRRRRRQRRLVLGLPAGAGLGLHLGQLLAAGRGACAAFPTAAIGLFGLVSGLLSLACHALLEPPVALSARDWLLIAVMGLGPLGAAFFLWDKALKRRRRAADRHPELPHAAGVHGPAGAGDRARASAPASRWPRR